MPAIRQDQTLLRLIRDVNEIRSALRRVTVNLPLFDISNENSPASLSSDQNNYVIWNYDVLKLTSSQDVSITGLRGGIKGRFLRLFNVGNYPITLEHQNASSDAENRFLFSNGFSAVIPPSSNITLYYDATQQRWVGGDAQSSGAVFALIKNTNNQSVPDTAVTLLDPGTVIVDQYGLYDDTNNRILIPFDGIYTINFGVVWQGVGGATGYIRQILQRAVYFDGDPPAYISGQHATQDVNGTAIRHDCTSVNFFEKGDYIDFSAQQLSPGALTMTITEVRVSVSRIL